MCTHYLASSGPLVRVWPPVVEYQPKHTAAVVCEMFRGFTGFIQADAHTIYDALYRGEAVAPGTGPPIEVACWSHARRKFWEAAYAKYDLGREGLLHMRILFQHEEAWQKLAPAQRFVMRQRVLKPLVDDFFTWREGIAIRFYCNARGDITNRRLR